MAKYTHDDVLDAALNIIKNNASKMILCSGQPATYADATTLSGSGGNKLGEIAVGSADFTVSDGNTSGRKVRVGQQTGVPIDGSLGSSLTWDHVAIVDDTGSRLLRVTSMNPSETVDGGQSVTVNAYDQEIADPT